MFDVGQILYLISNKNHKIVPARVEAVTTVKKINGTEISHQLSVPGHEKKVVLEKLDVNPFKDINELREHVMKMLRQKVDEEIENVLHISNEFWGEIPDQVGTTEQKPADNTKQSIQEVELENGIKARIHMPQELL